MKRTAGVSFVAVFAGTILGLFPSTADAQFAKTITVSPGKEVNAVTTWYYENCTTIVAVGSYTINVAPKHGGITVGGLSAPIPGCPSGSPPLPAAVAYYTWTDTASAATSDFFELYYHVNSQVAEVDDISVKLGSGGGSGGPGTSCAAVLNGGIAAPITGGSLFGAPTTILGSFTPASGYTLAQAAAICGFKKFDWQQTIIRLPDPSPFCENNTDPLQPNPNPFCGINITPPFPIHLSSLSAPINDPPPNGYTYGFYNSYPFYYPQATLETTCAQYGHGITGTYCQTPAVNAAGTTLSFFDDPADPCISGPGGTPSPSYLLDERQCGFNTSGPFAYLAFTTHLAGVNLDGTAYDLGMGYTWSSNFNGVFGGIAVTASDGSGTAGSGTGGVTVINVSNTTTYQYPRTSAPTQQMLSGREVEVTASGLSYSRVSGTYVGSITVQNISQSTINGPFQIVLNTLTPSVIMTNPGGYFGGAPYVVISGADSLVPGQSASINIQFNNSLNQQITFSPTVYAGDFN